MEVKCNYDKARLLASLSKIINQIRTRYIKDAEKAGHPKCKEMYKEIAAELQIARNKVTAAVVGLSKEDKFK